MDLTIRNKKPIRIKAGFYKFEGRTHVYNIMKYRDHWVVEDARNNRDNWAEPTLKAAVLSLNIMEV